MEAERRVAAHEERALVGQDRPLDQLLPPPRQPLGKDICEPFL
jgi:hypothetical protein